MRLGADGYPVSGRRTGIGRYTAELLKALARTPGIEVEAVLFGHHPAGPPEAADLHAAGVRTRHAGGVRGLAFRAGLKARVPMPLGLLLPRADALVYTNYRWYPPGRRPAVTFVYDLGYRLHPDLAHPRYLATLRREAEQAIARSDRVAVISQAVAGELAAVHPEAAGRIVVVPPGRTGLGPPLEPSQVHRRLAALGLEPGYLLHIGTIEPRKNLVRLISAVRRLPSGPPLVLVGDRGWSDGPILAAIAAAGERVVRLPFVPDPDLQALLRGAALLVAPSSYEGFGLPVLEALAHGTPVACSDLPVFHEVAGEAAAYVDHTDPAAIAAVVGRLLADQGERDRLAALGPPRAGRFTWPAAVAALVAELRALTRG